MMIKIPALEMALPVPTDKEKELFNKFIVPYDYLPTFAYLANGSNFRSEVQRSVSDNFSKRAFGTVEGLSKFFNRIITPLTLFWNERHDAEKLAQTILDNPVRGDRRPRPGKDPFDPTVPEDIRIAESLQGLRNWIDYYGGGFYALWRPELKRMVNDIAIIVNRRKVRPYRPTTPRSSHYSLNPIRTMVSEISQVPIDDAGTQFLWEVTVRIVLDGGRTEKVFRDFYDSEKAARNSDLFIDSKVLSVPEYIEKYKSNEVVEV